MIVADPELNQVVFTFRLDLGCALPTHTYRCHAIAYTLSGAWEHERIRLPTQSAAYTSADSTHTQSSEGGAELIVFLNSSTDRFIVNHMPDGTDLTLDMTLFTALRGGTREQAQAILPPAAETPR